ncbi:uncharacterized protein MEPE_03164 [Melanopsichium pennsylvanicum]|uniref:Transcription factor IIIC 90kDa subunit N-terminal domain-containing protein n=2 Tax=Melanopsichium pennsylvanicum TaxID=63383 RepID=A0AAJ4XKX5_9BASI|nr:conserved hypothetical protein [Melanopsichium pennsylvanicum 4]SNX84455.1 uncharacterized protein MEPE_03164 [Melanopsichium pennsylvanicum]
MAKESNLIHNSLPLNESKRIRACSIALSSGSSLLGNLQWSALGQALVITDDAIVILSPLTGLHPNLTGQSCAHNIENHPDWQGCFPHSVHHINVKAFLQNEQCVRSRTLLESDHTAVDPRYQGVQWQSASWSKPGMGAHGSCFILAWTSELDLYVLGAPHNAWSGGWELLHAIDPSPIVESITLDAVASDSDRCVFSHSRALLRKKQMATEILCASFLDLEEARSSTYIIAGTRSGHIATWKCQPVTGRCTFISATLVSSTGIEQLTLTTHTDAKDAQAQARIAFQDADGVRLCNWYVQADHATVQLSTAAPVLLYHCTISVWHWLGHHLIFCTTGKVHVYDLQSGNVIVFSLFTETNSRYDSFSPVISISNCSDPQYSVTVVRQDLREYRIPTLEVAQTRSLPRVLLSTYPPTLLGYPPMTENLQRKHDLHQAFLGYQADTSSSISSTSLVGVVRTDERIAFLGFNVSENVCYQLEVQGDLCITLAAALDTALTQLQKETKMRPFLLVRSILALLHTSQQKDAFKDLLLAVGDRWQSLLNDASSGGAVKAQKQLLYLLACRLENPSPDQPSALDPLMKRHRQSVLIEWLHRWAVDGKDATTLATGSCAACDTPLTLSSDEAQSNFGWAKCQKGHVWPRCSVTLATISDRQVRVCTGCWAKALLSGKAGLSEDQICMLETAANCLYCGSCWIVR